MIRISLEWSALAIRTSMGGLDLEIFYCLGRGLRLFSDQFVGQLHIKTNAKDELPLTELFTVDL